MIKIESGHKKYFDRNGKEITEGCKIKYLHSERVYEVYRTEEDELGTDATSPKWIERGRAEPCEYGIYPLNEEDTEMAVVVG